MRQDMGSIREVFAIVKKQIPNIKHKDIAQFVVVHTTPLSLYLQKYPQEDQHIDSILQGQRDLFLNVGSAQRRLKLARDAVARTRLPEVPCQRGCSLCCRLEPFVSGTEAQILLGLLGAYDVRRWEDFHLDKENYCPFLVGGACSIYQERPLSCRMHNTVETAENCRNIDGYPPYHFDLFLHQHISGYYTAEVFKLGEWGYGPMAEMLKHWSTGGHRG